MDYDPKGNYLISFSGGRTSAYMTWRFLREYPDSNTVVVFANTGQEDEKTLEFVKDCDDRLGFNTVWVEAKVSRKKGQGTKHNVVDFHSASRDGGPYEEVIKKYGIPNRVTPHCTRELKQRPITSYARSLGWKPRMYKTVIGIRVDEVDRINSKANEMGLIYPLIKWSVDKSMVLDFWSKQNFDLMLPEHRGNCTWCWKKSYRKLFTLVEEDPNIFDFPREMEKKHGMSGPLPQKSGYPSKFFRGDKSTDELFEMADKEGWKKFTDQRYLDMTNGCSDSCEVFSEEDDDD